MTDDDQIDMAVCLSTLALDVSSLSDPATTASRVTDLAAKLIPCVAADIVRNTLAGELRIVASSDAGLSALTRRAWHLWPHLPLSPTVVEHYRGDHDGGSYSRQLRADCNIAAELIFDLRVGPDDYGHLRFLFRDGAAQSSTVVSVAAAFATHAMLALDRAALQFQVTNLRAALSNSRAIGTAIGILMARHSLRSDGAFEMLRTASQHQNRKLHDLAVDVCETGEIPPTPAPLRSAGLFGALTS